MPWSNIINIKGPQGQTGPAGSAGAAGTTTWAGITDKPTVIAAGATQEDARSAITAENASAKGAANGYASLDSAGKVPVTQLPSSVMEYQGTYNATTNTPTLTDGVGSAGDVYRVSVAGSRNFGSGSISLRVGDYIIYSGTVWQKSATTDAVASVAGKTGDVSLVVADVSGAVSSSDSRLSDSRTPTSAGQVADLSIVVFGVNTLRAANSYGDFPFGTRLSRAVTFTAVVFRAFTADASGNLVVELRKNGVQVSGTSTTIAAANQVAGNLSGGVSTTTGSWSFAAGDIISVYVTGVGTTPGRGLIADIAGLTV